MNDEVNRDLDIPEPTEVHRKEVSRRARSLVRKRRLFVSAMASGTIAIAAVVGVLVASSSGTVPARSTSAVSSPYGVAIAPQSATPSTASPTAPTAGPATSLAAPSHPVVTSPPATSPSSAPPLSATSTPTVPPAVGPSSGGGTGSGPVSSGQNATQAFDQLPSGTTQALFEDNFGDIILASPAQGQWGAAVVTSGGESLSVYQQTANPDGSIEVQVKSLGPATATVTIPNTAGSNASWTITFVINGSYNCVNNGVSC